MPISIRQFIALPLLYVMSTTASAVDVTASKEALSFVRTYCLDCHNRTKSKGDLVLDALKGDFSKDSERHLWRDVLGQLRLGEMPPEDANQPPAESVSQITAWINNQLIQAGDSMIVDQRELPANGNYVNHAQLFIEPKERRAATPSRLWRINPYIYRMRLIELVGTSTRETTQPRDPVRNQNDDGINPAFAIDRSQHGFSDYAVMYGFEDTSTDLLMTSAYHIAETLASSSAINVPSWYKQRQERSGKNDRKSKDEKKSPDHDLGPAPSSEQVASFIRDVYTCIMDVPPNASDLKRYTDLYQRTMSNSDWRTSVETALAAVMISPAAVFRIETGSGTKDQFGRRRLTPMQIAQAIGLSLFDSGPNDVLLDAAANGKLNTREQVAAMVQQLVDKPAILQFGHTTKNDRLPDSGPVMRFFREYFEYENAKSVFKDASGKPFYHNDSAVAAVLELDNVIRWVLGQDKQVLKTLLTTDKTFVDYDFFKKEKLSGKSLNDTFHKRRSSHLIYGFGANWKWIPNQPVSFPKGERMGILTHPAWLIAFSDNEKNQAIQRGRWIYTKLLGGTIPDAPITVNAQLPEDDHKTSLRDRMHVTREAYCWKCHSRMDPYGLPFEQYDFYGYYRTKEYGQPVDTSGKISIGDKEVDGNVSSPFEMMTRLAESRRVKQVFIRHAFRFFMGRNETLDDAPTMIDAEKAYDESDGSMKALIVSLLSSDSFLYRSMPTGDNK